ncbi:MAG: SNF2-related protein, partial [Luteolibacter sp.]
MSSGKLEVKVVSRDKGAFLHGKAGLITRSDGSTCSFIGSVNESIQGWDHSYETIWEDPSQEAADWVREEFDHLWEKARPLSEAVISEIDKAARKSEVSLKDALVKPKDLAKSSFQDTPIQRSGEDLAVWQKAFVEIWEEHRNLYGAARIILADEVGVGKTLSMAATGALSVLYGDGPFLILCPATLVDQWQVELIDKLGLPSAVWKGGRRGGWRDHTGHLIRMDDPDGILKCPYQIGIVSTGIITASTPEAEILKRGKFGMIALDEGHKARKKRGIGGKEADEEGLLHDFMMNIAGNTKHLVIGTATPIQTDKREIWDLMKIIAVGNEHVLGRTNSPWWDDSLSLGVVSGDFPLRTMDEAWEFLRSPLPSRAESEKVFGAIRDAFDVPDKKFFCDKSISELHDTFDWGFIVDEYESSRDEIPFMRKHNPLSRHVVLRRRETLENAELMPRIAVDIFPESKKSDGIF